MTTIVNSSNLDIYTSFWFCGSITEKDCIRLDRCYFKNDRIEYTILKICSDNNLEWADQDLDDIEKRAAKELNHKGFENLLRYKPTSKFFAIKLNFRSVNRKQKNKEVLNIHDSR